MSFHCPFCNASLAGVSRQNGVTPCPRCGEPLPESITSQLGTAPETSSTSANSSPEVPGKMKTLVLLIAIMSAMAGLTIGYTLYTVEFRRKNDPPLPQITAIQPIELNPLGFVPANSPVLAGIHWEELATSELGKKLLSDPPASLKSWIRYVEKWTGLKQEQIKHLAGGFRMEKGQPEFILALETKVPYNKKGLAKSITNGVVLPHPTKYFVQFPLEPIGQGILWGINETSLAIIIHFQETKVEDLDVIPPIARPDGTGLPLEIKNLFNERLSKKSVAWIVGNLESFPLKLLPNLSVPSLASVKKFSLGLYPGEDWTLEGNFFTGDEKSCRQLVATWEKEKWPNAKSVKVQGPPPEVIQSEAQWVTVQIRVTPEGLRKWLEPK